MFALKFERTFPEHSENIPCLLKNQLGYSAVNNYFCVPLKKEMRVCKLRQNFTFGQTYPFTISIEVLLSMAVHAFIMFTCR